MSDNSKSAIANAGNLIIPESYWYSFYYEQTSGIELQSQIAIVSANVSVFASPEGQELDSAFGETNQNGTAYSQLTGVLATASSGTVVISGTENVSVIVSGVEASASFGEISTQGQSIVNAEILLSGVSAEANISQISATADNPVTWSSSGQIKRYPANQFISATARPIFIQSNATAGNVYASGTNVISIIASVNSVELFTEFEPVIAYGVLSISDEELIVLLAA